jgi:D-tyrosyl-tRNA(Tyr) deacylase
MRAVIQRVSKASVKVDQKVIGKIEKGYLIYLGIHENDTKEQVEKMSNKIHHLRVFEDENGKMNLNLTQVNGSILLISQFTLYGDTKGNNRPSFIEAARPEVANPLYELMYKQLSQFHLVEKGIFGANMKVESINDGPVTIIIEL